MPTFATKLRKVTHDPDIVRRFALQQLRTRYARYQNWRTFSGPRRRMLAAAIALPPSPCRPMARTLYTRC